MRYINLLILLLLMGCGENADEKVSRLREEKAQLQKEQSESAKAQLINAYNPVIGWDSTEVFTYWYQENLCGEQKKVYFEGVINDIVKIDSANYIVKIYKQYDSRAFLIECRISEKMKIAFENDLKKEEGGFIVKVDTIKKLSLALTPEGDKYDGEYSIFLYYDTTQKLILLKGSLIDFRLFEHYSNF